MSRRDGYEWEKLPGLTLIDCEGQDGKCMDRAKWEKLLFACDKSVYSGGYFCDECKEKSDDN